MAIRTRSSDHHHQVEAFLIESLGDSELESMGRAWACLCHNLDYEFDSPVNLALRVAASLAVEERYRRALARRPAS